jgi:hypothetical protein
VNAETSTPPSQIAPPGQGSGFSVLPPGSVTTTLAGTVRADLAVALQVRPEPLRAQLPAGADPHPEGRTVAAVHGDVSSRARLGTVEGFIRRCLG